MRRLTAMQETLGEKKHKMQLDCPTRWDTMWFMVSTMIESKAAVCAVMASLDLSKIVLRDEVADAAEHDGEIKEQNRTVRMLTDDEWAFLSGMALILKGFHRLTKAVSGDKYITSSLVYPRVAALYAELADHYVDAACQWQPEQWRR
jgi:hypothetical protein